MKSIIGLSFLVAGCLKKPVSTDLEMVTQLTQAPQKASESPSGLDPSNQAGAEQTPVGQSNITGFFDKRLIDTEIKKHIEQISTCYAQRLSENPNCRVKISQILTSDRSM